MSLHHRRVKKHDDGDEDAWLITYADMVTLLLCFFIIMFALSSPDSQKFATIAGALSQYDIRNNTLPDEDPIAPLKDQLEMSIGASGYDQFIAVSKQDKFVSMELVSDSFFEPGSAQFTARGVEVLQSVAKQILTLADKPILLEVEGHTDDSPIATAKFPSNWELSSGRAASVVRFLAEHGFPKEKMRAVGYAETKPKAPNRDTAGQTIPANQSLNRRVVVRLLKPEPGSH